jgi:hypothetical protein
MMASENRYPLKETFHCQPISDHGLLTTSYWLLTIASGGPMEFESNLESVFRPKSVAVIGASTGPGKLGHDILANLKNGGFAGPLYPINPKAEEILGLKVFKSVTETPAPAEMAVVVIPAKIVTPTLEPGRRGSAFRMKWPRWSAVPVSGSSAPTVRGSTIPTILCAPPGRSSPPGGK